MKTLACQNHRAHFALTTETLRQENRLFHGTRGVSQNNGGAGFHSAFRDNATGCVYLSRFADGRPAPMHLLAGLPDEVVLERDTAGRIIAVKNTVIAGFVRANRFYTREQAARFLVV